MYLWPTGHRDECVKLQFDTLVCSCVLLDNKIKPEYWGNMVEISNTFLLISFEPTWVLTYIGPLNLSRLKVIINIDSTVPPTAKYRPPPYCCIFSWATQVLIRFYFLQSSEYHLPIYLATNGLPMYRLFQWRRNSTVTVLKMCQYFNRK